MDQPARAVQLRSEYLENPLGIDVPKPRLCWQTADARPGARQFAYQLIAATTPELIKQEKGDLWDTGKVDSPQSVHVEYAGRKLKSGERCYWSVRLWDHDQKPTPWSEPAWFEMGLLDRAEWGASWIGSAIVGGPRTSAPSPYLRKITRFSGDIARARLYVTALGLYEFYINGQRVGEDIFTPGRTEYVKRVPYQAYDVTNLLHAGENVLGAILGDGWYCGHVHTDPRQLNGDRPRLLTRLVVELKDGSKTSIVSDNSWKTAAGPIRSSDFLMGEDYDARLELPGWNNTGFDESQWQGVQVFADPGIVLMARQMPSVRRAGEIRPIDEPRKLTRRRWIFDLGQNMVGWIRVRCTGPAGTIVTIRCSEMLDKDSMLYTTALRGARATDYYTKKTDGEEIYEPRFTFHGFRYVEIRGIHGEATADTITGVVLYTGLESTGTFECSDPMINQLQSNITWSQRGNFLEIPTDCPQRDERLGWTGDAQVFIRTAAFNMNVAPFFTKWLQDVTDAQFPDGGIPSTVPFCPSIPNEGGPAWSDAAIICPWTIYLCYGDTRILAERYETMARFIDFMKQTSDGYIRPPIDAKWKGYGDWLSINAETPNEIIGTAFLAHDARLMSKIARVLGKEADAAAYQKLFEDVRAVWQKRFVSPGGLIVGQTQTAYVLGLWFDLLPEEMRSPAISALVRNIESRGMHLSTGFVGTPYLTHVLTAAGRTDVAFALLMQKTFPSWLFPVTHGATTMWERWDGWTPEKGFNDAGMNSYNHYAYGAVGEWMYSAIAGIDLDPDRPAYQHILIRPHVGGGLTHARATLKSLYGQIESGWRLEGDTFHLNVTIPPNTTATVHLPSGAKHDVQAGRHFYSEKHQQTRTV